MDSLPQELVDNIVNHVQPCYYRKLLTVSRVFQVAVERLHLAHLNRVNSNNIRQSLSKYRGYRTRFLRDISFVVEFPELKHTLEKHLKCRETIEGLQHNDEIFTRQVLTLFEAIQALQERETEPTNKPSGIELTIHIGKQRDDIAKFCHHRRYPSWRLHLLKPKDLPELPSIRSLCFNSVPGFDAGIRPMGLNLISDLLFKLPNLETLECAHLYERFPFDFKHPILRHFTHLYEGPLRDSRHDFARAIQNAQSTGVGQFPRLPATLRLVILDFWEPVQKYSNIDQSRSLADLTYPKSHDPLSSAIRVFSQGLTELSLRIIADSTLFWPQSPAEIEPSWPNLKHLFVEFHPSTPRGSWYFAGPRGEGADAIGFIIKDQHYPPLTENPADEEWDNIWSADSADMDIEDCEPDEFRTEPIPENIEPLLESFARALRCMPILEEARLFTYLGWDPNEFRAIEYEGNAPFAAGESLHRWGVRYLPARRGERSKPLLEWQVGDWRPSESVMRLFRGISSDDGEELEVEWKEFVIVDEESRFD